MFLLLPAAIIVCIFLLYLMVLLHKMVFKYVDRVASMPLMKWMPFYEICRNYFDDSEFWAQMILLALMKGKAIEARPQEGFEDECIEDPAFRDLQYQIESLTMYEFRLTYRPRRKRRPRLLSGEWFEKEPALQPVSA